jgi:serine protease Do
MHGKIFVFISLLLIMIRFPQAQAQSEPVQQILRIEDLSSVFKQAVEAAIERVKPALVRIHVVTVVDHQGREVRYESVGSGVIISAQGHIITNHHVAGRAQRIICTLFSKAEIDADLVGSDPLSDICVIKLRSPDSRQFQYAGFGDSDLLRVGDYVLAMGSPLALSQSVTMGIISNTEMVMPDVLRPFKLTLEGEDVGSIVRWIGHDAPIYPGNSGGPLVNLQGEIVGINEISFGIGGAIPVNLAKRVAEELTISGVVKRAWTGLEVQPLLKSYIGSAGALVSGVIEGSPAEQAGFRSGDILVQFAGHEIYVRFNEELPSLNQLLMNQPIGKRIEAMVLRNGKEMELNVVPTERQYIWPQPVEIKRWGITVRDISYMAAKELKIDSQDGVLVTSVRPGGPCGDAKPEIIDKDIIVEVNGKKMRRVEDLIELTEVLESQENMPSSVLVAFERKDGHYITVVTLDTTSMKDQGRELEKAWLGIATQIFTKEISDLLDTKGYPGVRVVQVFKNGTAARYGIRVGDVITAINGESVEATAPADIGILPAMIRKYDIGARIILTIVRDRQEMQLPVTLGSSPKAPAEMKKYRDDNFEFTVRDIAFEDIIDQRLPPDQVGVLVADISDGSLAALANLLVDDIILQVDEQLIADVASFEIIMKKIAERKSKIVALKVLRGIHTRYIELVPDWGASH